jgi:toxin ParE1/3/4
LLTRRAQADLLDISVHTMTTWGEAQSFRYVDDLNEFCQRLAETPLLGRACDAISPGLRRIEFRKQVVFYRQIKGGIRISRILHERMLADRERLTN